MAFNLDKGKDNAKSIRDILTDINRLSEENLKLEKQKLATEQRINAEQQDISNVLKDQTKQLQFQKAEKSAILRSTNSISRISENISTFQKQELVDAKAISKLGKDKLKIDKDISLLRQTQKKLTTETAGLTADEVKANFALAGSMDDQIKNAIILKAEISAIEKSSNKVFNTDGVKNAKFMGDVLNKVPGLSAFKGVFDGAADEAAKAVGEMESTNFGIDKYEELRKSGMEHEEAMEAAGVDQAKLDKGRFSLQQMNSKSIMVSMQSMLKSLKAALSPAAMLAAFLNAFISSDKAAGDMAKKLNVSYKDALGMRKELRASADATNENFVTTKGMQESLLAINESLGTGVMLNNQMLSEFTEMREMAGFTNEELQGIAAISLTTGKSMNDVTGEFMAQAQISAQQNGVLLNEKDLLKDIGKISAATTLSFSKNPKLIAEAVATAKSLGMELSKVDAIAGSLLDFESSIQNELEAELLLNKDINLEKARQAALNNDLATVAKEISDQIGSSAEFAEMNRIQQEALAKAVGMNREDLAATLLMEDKLKGLTAEKAAIAQKDFDTLKARVGQEEAMRILEEKGAAGLSKQVGMADRFNATMEKLKEIFVVVGEALMPILSSLVSVFDILGPVFAILNPLIQTALFPLGILADVLKTIIFLAKSFANLFGAGLDTSDFAFGESTIGAGNRMAQSVGVEAPTDPKKYAMLADGGIITGPTRAIVGEAGPEAVIPLSGNTPSLVDMSSTNALLEKLVKKTPEMAPLGLYEVQ